MKFKRYESESGTAEIVEINANQITLSRVRLRKEYLSRYVEHCSSYMYMRMRHCE